MGNHRRGVLLAAPASGSGKTLLTLAILRALSRNRKDGVRVCGAKAGPDFIDPAFHAIACGQPSFNLDPWAMTPGRISALAKAGEGDLLVVEAMMGLFDGAADGSGSGADLAAMLGLPVVLVVDAAKQSHSIGALVKGFATFRPDITVAGVVLNKVGSERHERMLQAALAPLGIPVLGTIPRHEDLVLPERHLGLVQAGEIDGIDGFIEGAAEIIERHCDLKALIAIAALIKAPGSVGVPAIPILPLGQKIAIAEDAAFSFTYPHLAEDWRSQGAEISMFSPLADEAPVKDADAVYLPGGYPELYCGQLAGAARFRQGMISAKERNTVIYGECGGYMVLGKGIVDGNGDQFAMLDFLDVETSFEKRKLHLGYRKVKSLGGVLNSAAYSAHEFHYTSALEEKGERLFSASDAMGNDLGETGLRAGHVFGSYMHVIDRIG